MSSKKIGAYLDSGSIGLFAQQICDGISGAFSVAIHDQNRQLVWAGPTADDHRRWAQSDMVNSDFEGPGHCQRLGRDDWAYVFRLQGEDKESPGGTISVLAFSTHPMSFEYALDEVKPVVSCIERQLSINVELSAVRKISARDQKNLKLLIGLDAIEATANSNEILQQILELTAKHFGADIAAVMLPHMKIQEIYPPESSSDPGVARPIDATLTSLLDAVHKHKRVLISDTNMSVAQAGTEGNVKPKLLCGPIINSRDHVVGVLALLSQASFPRGSARLIRAICAKINALTRMADQMRNEHFSRHAFLHHVAGVMQRHENSIHAVVYLDIDQLHVVNESHGHMAGDQVIRHVMRVVDELAGKDDALAHLSGDRIGIFLRDCDIAKATSRAEVILSTLARTPVEYNDQYIAASASIGIAMIPDVARDPSTAINIAEVAAKTAKDRGGNRCVVYQAADASVLQRRSDLDQVNYLQAALLDSRFVLYAQPIASLNNPYGNMRFELLVRMLDDEGQVVSPDKFMSSAERYQMMAALDRWVINHAIDQIASADNVIEVNLSNFAINVSGQSLIDDDFTDFVADRIATSGIAPDAFCFEITETAVVRNLDRAQRFIRQLRKLGCRLALDDFGTGHCSFAYLKDLPVQCLKIDGVFVRDILENPLSEAIVRSVVSIAEVMHAATVAEHVENELVVQRLR